MRPRQRRYSKNSNRRPLPITPFQVVFERVKHAEFRDHTLMRTIYFYYSLPGSCLAVKKAVFRGHAVIKNDLYQFISTISLLYLDFFNIERHTLDYSNSPNPLTYLPKGNISLLYLCFFKKKQLPLNDSNLPNRSSSQANHNRTSIFRVENRRRMCSRQGREVVFLGRHIPGAERGLPRKAQFDPARAGSVFRNQIEKSP